MEYPLFAWLEPRPSIENFEGKLGNAPLNGEFSSAMCDDQKVKVTENIKKNMQHPTCNGIFPKWTHNPGDF